MSTDEKPPEESVTIHDASAYVVLAAARQRIASLEAERDAANRALQTAREALEAARDIRRMHYCLASEALDDIIAGALKAMGTPEDSARVAQVPAPGPISPATPAAPMCPKWCGTEEGAPTVMRYESNTHDYCSKACRAAGRPLHPTTPTPTDPR